MIVNSTINMTKRKFKAINQYKMGKGSRNSTSIMARFAWQDFAMRLTLNVTKSPQKKKKQQQQPNPVQNRVLKSSYHGERVIANKSKGFVFL